MTQREPLDAFETLEAVEALHTILHERPETFGAAFAKAYGMRGATLEGDETSVANEWATQHAASLTDTPETATYAANAILGRVHPLKDLGAKVRFHLADTLFPYFELPTGWRRIAEAAGLRPGHITAFITERVKAINSPEDAQRETAFIRQLLAVPNNPKERYQPIMTPVQLRVIRNTLLAYAPEQMHAVHDPRSMGWRHGLL